MRAWKAQYEVLRDDANKLPEHKRPFDGYRYNHQLLKLLELLDIATIRPAAEVRAEALREAADRYGQSAFGNHDMEAAETFVVAFLTDLAEQEKGAE